MELFIVVIIFVAFVYIKGLSNDKEREFLMSKEGVEFMTSNNSISWQIMIINSHPKFMSKSEYTKYQNEIKLLKRMYKIQGLTEKGKPQESKKRFNQIKEEFIRIGFASDISRDFAKQLIENGIIDYVNTMEKFKMGNMNDTNDSDQIKKYNNEKLSKQEENVQNQQVNRKQVYQVVYENNSKSEVSKDYTVIEHNKNMENANIKKCEYCGMTYTEDNKFCSHCGREILDKKYCSECGEKLLLGAMFCYKCGKSTY